MSTNNLKRLKDQSALKLDNYNTAVEGGRGLTADDLRHEVTNKKTAVNNHKNASES